MAMILEIWEVPQLIHISFVNSLSTLRHFSTPLFVPLLLEIKTAYLKELLWIDILWLSYWSMLYSSILHFLFFLVHDHST